MKPKLLPTPRAALVVLAFAALGRAQAPAPPRFDVVSVKPHGVGAPVPGQLLPAHGEWIPGAISLASLISLAYDLPAMRIAGLPPPSAGRPPRFDIAAKLPPDTSPADFRLMVQAMLADRFHLATHRETRALEVHPIGVSRSGFKLAPLTGECPDDPPSPAAARPADFPRHLACGEFAILPGESGDLSDQRLFARAVTLGELASSPMLTNPRRLVVDDTGIAGRFDLALDIRLQAGSDDVQRKTADNLAAWGLAFQQIGLTLDLGQPQKRTLEVLVVDHFEAPAANRFLSALRPTAFMPPMAATGSYFAKDPISRR